MDVDVEVQNQNLYKNLLGLRNLKDKSYEKYSSTYLAYVYPMSVLELEGIAVYVLKRNSPF